MSRKNERDERDWPRQQQNWPEQNEWSGGRRERQDERNWRDQDYDPRSGQEMGGRWQRRQRMQGTDQWGRENEHEMWEARRREQGYGAGWDRGERDWESDFDTRQNRLSNWGERYSGIGTRGWMQGWHEAMHREGPYTGRGPRGYKRSDSRIEEDINDRLTQHGMIDASDIEVSVQDGEVTLRGVVEHREAKWLAEEIAESVFGVKEVNNQIKVKQRGEAEGTIRKAG